MIPATCQCQHILYSSLYCCLVLSMSHWLQVCWRDRRTSLGGRGEISQYWQGHAFLLCHSLSSIQLHILASVFDSLNPKCFLGPNKVGHIMALILFFSLIEKCLRTNRQTAPKLPLNAQILFFINLHTHPYSAVLFMLLIMTKLFTVISISFRSF